MFIGPVNEKMEISQQRTTDVTLYNCSHEKYPQLLTTIGQIPVSGLFSLYPTSTGLIIFKKFITNKILTEIT